MTLGVSSVRTVAEFRFYFPNATYSSPMDFLRPTPLDTYRIVLIIAFSTLLISGISGNFWVLRVVGIVLRQTRTEAPRAVQIFILALCACDVFVLAFLFFLLLDLWYGQWVVPSSFLCQSYLISESLSKFYAPFLLVELSGFCYLSVRRRRKSSAFVASSNSSAGGSRSSTSKTALIAVVLALGLAFAAMTPVYLYSDIYFLIIHNDSDIQNVLAKCAFQPPEYVMTTFTVYSFICGYLIPACLFTIFYAALLIYVHRRRRKSSCTTVKSLDYFSRVAKTSLGLVLFYFASWTPYWSMSLYQYLTPPPDDFEEVSNAFVVLSYFIHMLPYVNCNAYPLLYTIMNRSIQHDYLRACEQSRSLRQRQKESSFGGSFRASVLRGSFRSSRGSVQMSESNSTTLVAAIEHAALARNASKFSSTESMGSKGSRNRLRPPGMMMDKIEKIKLTTCLDKETLQQALLTNEKGYKENDSLLMNL